jgi:tetratricopeptide (TPR) repeat protein
MKEIGRIHYFQEEYSAAKAHLTRAKDDFSTHRSIEDLIQTAYYLAWVEFREGNSQEANYILTEAK